VEVSSREVVRLLTHAGLRRRKGRAIPPWSPPPAH
jgi:hypothetical protein